VDSEEPENTVISRDIEANSSAEAGSTIYFEYSSGEAPEESEATGSVVYRMPIPTNATGTFSLDFTVNGVSIATTRFSATAGVTDIEQEITGSGSQTVIVILTNETTGANTQLGSYTFDFTSMNFSTITEDINAAFERVGGLTDYNEEPAQEEQQYYNDTPQYIE
jgi:beta-lactam-binding protein with PASTA domain